MISSAYFKLEQRFRRLSVLRDATEALQWDYATMMPSGGGPGRGEQLAELSGVCHGLLNDPEIGDLLDKAQDETTLSPWQAANLKAMRRKWTHATALSKDLVLAYSKACTGCETVWRTARADGDFAAVLPHMETLLSLVRERAAAKAEKLGLCQYDALLDEFEPGGRSADIDVRFAELESFLPEFLNEVLEKQKIDPAPPMPEGPFDPEKQRELGLKLMTALGFDFNHGRLDVSLHPFCGGTPDDVRITTRFNENDFSSAIMGVLHETGHGLYQRGLPPDWRYQPVGEALGMGAHESQSLLIEMQVSRSRPFLEFAAPLMRETFDGSGPAWDTSSLYRNLIKVEPDFIRVDADEVTYPLHIILRYRLEKLMIAGDLPLVDLPEAWNDSMKKLLGLDPANDREGCLQDIHWYDGAWGYFPTYTLGAMTAAQLYAAALTTRPEILAGIPDGNFKPLLDWLKENVHSLGSSLSAGDMVEQASGKPLNADAFIHHLKSRYLA
ncbi:MAG: carboxypeptidase M32 [Rhodospirillales bacterium]|nr:carboxypeptidase M32 [Rhodospirillales bacterium]